MHAWEVELQITQVIYIGAAIIVQKYALGINLCIDLQVCKITNANL